MILWLFYLNRALHFAVYPFTWLKRSAKGVPLFILLCSLFLPFPSLLSICPLVCLICFLPEGETIFWMSPALINWCQRPPCSAYSCSEWQIILCHRESVREAGREREGGREMLAVCLSSLVASAIAAASHLHRSTSGKVWRLGGDVVQILTHHTTQAAGTYSSTSRIICRVSTDRNFPTKHLCFYIPVSPAVCLLLTDWEEIMDKQFKARSQRWSLVFQLLWL